MSMWVHIVLAVVITVYFLSRYIKDKQLYELLFVIWVPSTLVQYILKSPTGLRILGIFQIIMFLLVIYFMFKRRGYRRHKTAEILAKYSTGDLDGAVEASNDNLSAIGEEEAKAADPEKKPEDDKPNI